MLRRLQQEKKARRLRLERDDTEEAEQIRLSLDRMREKDRQEIEEKRKRIQDNIAKSKR